MVVLRPVLPPPRYPFSDDRDIGDAVLPGEIVGRRETVPATADNHRVVGVFGRCVAPGPRPVLVVAPGVFEQAEERIFFHGLGASQVIRYGQVFSNRRRRHQHRMRPSHLGSKPSSTAEPASVPRPKTPRSTYAVVYELQHRSPCRSSDRRLQYSGDLCLAA